MFAMYISPVDDFVAAHSLCYHQYADDTQLYMAVRPCADVTFKAVPECIEDVTRWFLENGLLSTQPRPKQSYYFGNKAQREKIPVASGIDVAAR